ncbi:hypothetical protein OW763_08570 [Clostridium aestuarii]|uniref:Uncharacterized protein n=1 Tax=Clostridium aestuarii TaxID=338193 RepID=A0ABT4CZK3_9CLOT|nr:hypothetical protein [Clostridium aestuarii]MCY6484410.1 hypothetical protein [Clostridium aestuarii]
MLRYIGPFLRMNKLSINQIRSQLFHLSKESIKDIVLYSKSGITIDLKDLNLKNISSTDINTLNLTSPLLCIYKRATPSLKMKDNTLSWNENKVKKVVNISSNAYMTLCLLELVDYYKKFKNIDSTKYAYSTLLIELSKKQLEFYVSYLRNEEGVFIDKKDCTDSITGELRFKPKNKEFKFSEQALLMNAYYKCSTYLEDKFKESYKNFSMDILNMFIEFKDELYNTSFDNKCKTCLNLNIFYSYSKMEDVKPLLLDIFDLLYEEYSSKIYSTYNIEYLCLLYLNSTLLYENTDIYKFKKIAENLYKDIAKYYKEDLSIFIKPSENKEMQFSAKEIILYILSGLYQLKFDEDIEDINEEMIINIFTNQLVNSGIILSWPDAPTLDDIERYKGFIEKSENLLDEQYFKLPTIATPERNELAPIFIKYVNYNKSKKIFKQGKLTFDSRKNLNLFFIILYFFNHNSNIY